jgi:hypothetical protein
MEFLKHHPVADHTLDIVRHHGEDEGDELGTEAAVAHHRKGPPGRRRQACAGESDFSHKLRNILPAAKLRGATARKKHFINRGRGREFAT